MATSKYPRTREGLEKELEIQKAEEKARTPGMCAFMLGNFMGCRKFAQSPSQFCARHIVIDQMIQTGTLSPVDLSVELIAQPL